MQFLARPSQLHQIVGNAVYEYQNLMSDPELTQEMKEARKQELLVRFRNALREEQAKPGFQIDALDADRQTPLMYALQEPEIMEILLLAGANPNLHDILNYYPLHTLAFTPVHNIEPYLVLLAYGADIGSRRESRYIDAKTPLEYYLYQTTTPLGEAKPRRQNPEVIELLRTPIPEAERPFLLSRLAASRRRRQALSAYGRAHTRSGGRRHTRRKRQSRNRRRI